MSGFRVRSHCSTYAPQSSCVIYVAHWCKSVQHTWRIQFLRHTCGYLKTWLRGSLFISSCIHNYRFSDVINRPRISQTRISYTQEQRNEQKFVTAFHIHSMCLAAVTLVHVTVHRFLMATFVHCIHTKHIKCMKIYGKLKRFWATAFSNWTL